MLALSLGAAAQQRVRGSRNQAQLQIINPGLVQQIYQQARRAAANAPALLAPAMMRQIGVDELRPFSRDTDQAALADLGTAFALARALPVHTGDATLDPVRAQIKAEVEEQTVADLARHGERQQALQLTRLADVPKAPLYGQIIAAAARPDWNRWNSDDVAPDPNAAAKRQALLNSVDQLVSECERASGQYPYRGVTELLRRGGPSGLERMLLVQEGYRWAGNETDPARIDTAVMFLHAAHDAEPELDSDLQSTIESMLNHLARVPLSQAGGASHNAAPRLVELLRDLDPVAATAWNAQWPALASPAGPLFPEGYNFSVQAMQSGQGHFQVVFPRGMNSHGLSALTLNDGRVQMSFSTTVSAPAPDPDVQISGEERFRVLAAEAEAERHDHPAQALDDANQATAMLNRSLWPAVATAAIRLVAVYQQLGSNADAARLLQGCLDEARREALALDTAYASNQVSQQADLARDLNRAGASVLTIYGEAARLDFNTTAERAEMASFTLLKPLVLARVALVGAVEQRRAERQQPPQ